VQWTRCPDGEVPARFLERVARLLSTDVQELPGAAPPAGGATSPLAPARPHRARRRTLYGAALAVALLAVGALMTYQFTHRGTAIGLVAVRSVSRA